MPDRSQSSRRVQDWIRSNILGLVAIFIALSGTAIAANVASHDVAQVAKKKKKVKRGPAGPPGAQGPQGQSGSPDTGAQILGKLAGVDGSGSGLDADTVDGVSSSAFVTPGTEPWHMVGPASDTGDCTMEQIFCGQAAGFNKCGWGNNSAVANPAAFLRDQSGFVHLKGGVGFIDSTIGGCDPHSQNIFWLPPGYRPASNGMFPSISGTNTGNEELAAIDVSAAGPISYGIGDGTLGLSLDGISFRCEPSGSNGCP